jgi:preprotein translocase subunit YajC
MQPERFAWVSAHDGTRGARPMIEASGLLALAPPTGGQGGSALSGLIPIVLMFVIFYFLLIAPQRKKAKAHAAMLEALKSGDRVITNGGIYGTVVGVDDQKVLLRIADQVKIEVAKQAIAGMQQADS